MTLSKVELENLVKIATKLDDQGMEEEAKQVDLAIAKLVQAAKEEEKEEATAKGLTGKQKAACRAFRAAAERVDKVFFNGIPRACKKLDDLASEVLACCKDIEMD